MKQYDRQIIYYARPSTTPFGLTFNRESETTNCIHSQRLLIRYYYYHY